MTKYFYELMTDVRKDPLAQILKVILWMFSLVYGLMVRITRSLYQLKVLGVFESQKPVISVGNITCGGVGKTPLVIWIAQILQHKGIKPVVLTRGYKAQDGLNDETKMFQEIMPQISIMVGRDRGASIERVIAHEPVQVFVADDAFQHWPLKRDLDIVAIDAVNPFGNGYLVPRGILREEIGALSRADVFVLTKTDRVRSTEDLRKQLGRVNSKALIVESKHALSGFKNLFHGTVQDLRNQKVISMCSIGDPSSLEHTLQKAGVVTTKSFVFPDHYHYSVEDLKRVLEEAKAGNMNILVTTHKDAVKIKPFQEILLGFNVVIADIQLEITQGQDEFIKRILSVSHR